ncbi:MAG: BrnA antitoxin family protein [Caldilineaceae bacterium]
MSNENQTSAVSVEVTEEEYQTDLACGLAEDEVLQPGRHTFRRGAFLARHGLTPEQRTAPAKVRVSIDLDQDVLAFVKNRTATSTEDISYETQINEILRTVMEEETDPSPTHLSPQAKALLANVDFIDAVAKRVAERVAAHFAEPA